MTGHLIVTDEDATRVITLRRPEKKNAITQDMYRLMSDAIDTAQNNPNDPLHHHHRRLRRVHRRQRPRGFPERGHLEYRHRRAPPTPSKFLYSLAHNVKPIIAAVDGVAIGIGTTMLFHCDYVLASNDRDVLDALHPSGPGAGRRLQPADAAHHGPPARVCDAGDGSHRHRRRRASRASSTWWLRPATPKPRPARSRARSARCRRRRSRSRASC